MGAGRVRRMLVNVVLMAHVVPNGLRTRGLRACGISVGTGTKIRSRSLVKTLNVSIGERSFVNHGVHIDDGGLTIGNRVYVGPGATFATGSHEIGGPEQRAGKHLTRPIRVDDGVWIGADSTILGGVTIAKGCIIAAGAVVTRSTEPHGLYAGVPARRVRNLPLP